MSVVRRGVPNPRALAPRPLISAGQVSSAARATTLQVEAALTAKAGSATEDVKGLLGKAWNGIQTAGFAAYAGITGGTSKAFTSRSVDDVAADSDDPSRAARELKANQPAEQAALSKLSTGDRLAYQQVAALVAKDPIAARSLQQILLDGRLTGQKALVGGGSLLAQLDALASEPLASGIERPDVLGCAIKESENPVRIAQQAMGTCGATTAQILLARHHPAEYARLIAGLATPAGSVKMAGGDTLTRHADWANPNDGGRTTSCRLFQPAAMQEAEPFGLSYDNSSDKAKLGSIPLIGGMLDAGQARLDTQLEGTKYKAVSFYAFDHAASWNTVKQALSAGKGPIPVSVIWNDGDGEGGHFLQVDKVEKGTVYYTNPWGQTEHMSESEFAAHVTGAEIPA